MPSAGRTYEDHLMYCEKIEHIVKDFDLSYPLLATLARLEKRSTPARIKDTEAGWLMESEFAGIGTDLLVERNLVEREFRPFEWHPSGNKGTYVYRMTQFGQTLLSGCKAMIREAGQRLYY